VGGIQSAFLSLRETPVYDSCLYHVGQSVTNMTIPSGKAGGFSCLAVIYILGRTGVLLLSKKGD
jgi:hypothetical protein